MIVALTLIGSVAQRVQGQNSISDDQTNANARSSEIAELEDYLIEHRIDSLLIEHLETRLQRATDVGERNVLAARLAIQYSRRLISLHVENKKGEAQRWQAKATGLSAMFPGLDSDDLRIAVLHARYLEQEDHFQSAWNDAANSGAFEMLVEPWESLSRDLIGTTELLNEKSETLFAQQQSESIGSTGSPAIAKQIATVESQMQHCHYLNGWTSYLRAATESRDRAKWLDRSESEFRQFLLVNETQSLLELSAAWFDFSSPWSTRAVVGLASALHANGENPANPIGMKEKESQHLFALLNSQTIDRSSRELVPLWRLNNESYFRKFDRVIGIADTVAIRNDLTYESLTQFWLAAFEAAQVAVQDNRQLGQILMKRSLVGLTRQMNGAILDELAQDHPSVFQFHDDQFNDAWIGGYLELYRSQKSIEHGQVRGATFESAKRLLSRALQIKPDPAYKDDWSRCEYLLARIHYREGDLGQSSREFQHVADLLESRDRRLAAEAQWLAIESLVKLSRSDDRRINEAFAAIDRIFKRFPGTQYAQRAKFEKVRLEIRSVPLDQAVSRLSQFKIGNSSFPFAQSEIVNLKYRIWLTAHQKKDQHATEKLEQFLGASSSLSSTAVIPIELKLKSTLLSVDALLRQTPLNLSRIGMSISDASEWSTNVAVNSPMIVELRYYQLLLAQKTDGLESATLHANWIVKNGGGTKFETPALIFLAKQIDRLGDDQLSHDATLCKSAIETYQRLSKRVGQSEEKLFQSANARVAIARLARLYQICGSPEQADPIYGLLLTCFPNNQDYLRQSAIVKTNLQQPQEAIKLWSKIASGVTPGSDSWFEAKLELVNALKVEDPESAKKLFQQTIQLGGEIPGTWKIRFVNVGRQLGIEK